ncbi:cation diffusion facilitator family transporter [Desulfovibrio sp. X2]|uniref:cation diffusion facilitator family transporter n=1 Tax=Desulfovibrio sp. X2 TaxID=941449 RepID=UPI000358E53E|nr:cation diffusion facilitator family transporter [Desulfovibrio sp. X2]EPR41095.1 cation diffusion facilitator family transporter [Desulfovibrio sp. X2]
MTQRHTHGISSHDRAFAVGIALNVAFVLVEAWFGFAADSLALIADAGHNLSDVLSLLLAWAAAWLSGLRPTSRFTYGFGKSSVLASLLNASILFIAVGAISLEAVQRFGSPEPVATGTVMLVASVGIAVNAATAVMFLRGREKDINIRGAFLHMAADTVVSVGVVVAAGLMRWTGRQWIDPLLSLVIAAAIAVSSWGLLRESLRLTLDAVPEGIDRRAVKRYLAALPGVEAVHDLHIWALSTTRVALTAHLVRPHGGPDHEGADAFLDEVGRELHDRYGIGHATIQLEHSPCENGCSLPPER